jgi:uncharacterized protein YchJ
MGAKVFPPTTRCLCGSGKHFAVCCASQGVDPTQLEANVAASMREAGVAPALVYAYQRTHLIVTLEHRKKPLAFAAELDEWNDAVAEYREHHPVN